MNTLLHFVRIAKLRTSNLVFFVDKMMKIKEFEYRFVIYYLIIGGSWIIFSDRILEFFVTDPATMTTIQTYKGWLYVIVTAFVFFLLIRKHVRKLREAELHAKESDRMKAAFLHNISHEIRTPMNGIVGFAELLEEESLASHKRLKYLSTIQKSSKRLLSMVNTLLEFSMLESESREIKNKSFSINELMDSVVDDNRKLVNKNVELIVRKSFGDNKMFNSDKQKLQMILKHLLQNAIKFTYDGKIEFAYEFVEDELIFSVSDTGCGIELDQIEKIFNTFHKIEGGEIPIFEGVGLGLSICQEYTTLLGGEISVMSKLGEGSTFEVLIPQKRDS